MKLRYVYKYSLVIYIFARVFTILQCSRLTITATILEYGTICLSTYCEDEMPKGISIPNLRAPRIVV